MTHFNGLYYLEKELQIFLSSSSVYITEKKLVRCNVGMSDLMRYILVLTQHFYEH